MKEKLAMDGQQNGKQVSVKSFDKAKILLDKVNSAVKEYDELLKPFAVSILLNVSFGQFDVKGLKGIPDVPALPVVPMVSSEAPVSQDINDFYASANPEPEIG